MGLLDTLAPLVLPPAALEALAVAEQMPAALAAARGALDAGRGPLHALRAFTAATDGHLDDAVVEQLERWLATGMDRLDEAIAAAAWLSRQEPALRSIFNEAWSVVFSIAYQADAVRDLLQRWRE